MAACGAWAVDNNLTRKVSAANATFIACVKGLVAGSVNLALAQVFAPASAAGLAAGAVGAALVVGVVGPLSAYGQRRRLNRLAALAEFLHRRAIVYTA